MTNYKLFIGLLSEDAQGHSLNLVWLKFLFFFFFKVCNSQLCIDIIFIWNLLGWDPLHIKELFPAFNLIQPSVNLKWPLEY